MLLIRITNLLIFLFTTVCFILNFHKDGEWKAANGLYALRYFTILSNLLCALAALLVALNVSEQGLPFDIWLLKYVATAAVTVTFVTVMVFLGPTMGYKSQLEHAGFYYHAAGPLMAVLSFCFMEHFHELSAELSLTGMLPVILYGLLYTWKVLFCPKERRWEDFYGFTKGSRWQLSACAMLLGSFLICLLLRFLYRL